MHRSTTRLGHETFNLEKGVRSSYGVPNLFREGWLGVKRAAVNRHKWGSNPYLGAKPRKQSWRTYYLGKCYLMVLYRDTRHDCFLPNNMDASHNGSAGGCNPPVGNGIGGSNPSASTKHYASLS